MYEKISGSYSQRTGTKIADRTAEADLTFEISSTDYSDAAGVSKKIEWSVYSKASSQKNGLPPRRPVRLQSSGSLFTLRGRSITYLDDSIVSEIPFELSMDDAQTIESNQISGENEFIDILQNSSKISIKASNFSRGNHDVTDLELSFIIGEYKTGDSTLHPVLLCRGKVNMQHDLGSPDIICRDSTSALRTEHLFDRIIMLTSQVDLPKDLSTPNALHNRTAAPTDNAAKLITNLPKVLMKIVSLSLLFAIIMQPIRWTGNSVYQNFILYLSSETYLWVSSLTYYLLQIIRILLLLLILLIFMMTPLRYDFLQDFPVYFCVYFRSFFLLKEWGGGRLSFFVHGWNAWGFCGAVKQGKIIPVYSMPHVCVQAFHGGGPALPINFGRGKDERTPNAKSASSRESYSDDKRDYIASDMFTVLADTEARRAVVCGFLVQREQFGCVALNRAYDHMTVHVDCDGAVRTPKSTGLKSEEVLRTDWLYVQIQDDIEEDPLDCYLELAGHLNGVRDLFHTMPESNSIEKPLLEMVEDKDVDNSTGKYHSTGSDALSTVRHQVPCGWCSWYHFFEHVTEKDLTENITSMHSLKAENGMHAERIGFNLFQVDDGYQRAWGDWLQLHIKRFPSQSMGLLVDKIKAASMTPGLWMAPFACDIHSTLAKDHPDWILKRDCRLLDFKKKGEKVPANSANCGKWFFGLDVTNPAVRTHIQECITTATQHWGFEYLKLDFLYAAALSDAHSSYHDRSMTRAQAMQLGLDTVSESMGRSVFLLGCGAPMGSVLGKVHANRVSADAGLSWYPDSPLPYYDKWNLPCARNMVRNSICRMTMHGKWWINDPDCILLRKSTNYSDAEILGIATVKAMSDDLAAIPADRVRLAQQLLPATNIPAVPLDLMDKECPEILRLQLGRGRRPCGGISAAAGSHVTSCLDDWVVLGDCNWGDYTKSNIITANYLHLHTDTKGLSEGREGVPVSSPSDTADFEDYYILHILEFWSSSYGYRVMKPNKSNLSTVDSSLGAQPGVRGAQVLGMDEDLQLGAVSPHTAKLYALRLTQDPCSTPQYIGSNLHFTCGQEVKSFSFVLGPKRALDSDGLVPEYSNSCVIAFEHCSVRCEKWTGYVWLYLPHTKGLSEHPEGTGDEDAHDEGRDGDGDGDGGDSRDTGRCRGRGRGRVPLVGGSLAGCEGPSLVERILDPRSKGSAGAMAGCSVLGCVWRVPVASLSHSEVDELTVNW